MQEIPEVAVVVGFLVIFGLGVVLLVTVVLLVVILVVDCLVIGCLVGVVDVNTCCVGSVGF